jgi:hypothetical protein
VELNSFHSDDRTALPSVSVARMRQIDRIPIGMNIPNLFQMAEVAVGASTDRIGNWSKLPLGMQADVSGSSREI